ncbi:Murein DD-endopeptidase MepM and murein hydrolase activator NlpD, contain LysM domain [Brevinema andersonii]|uniref:Murein DD-endopeptidase MepM and murein hydrolase activator NlpD, contain LysM domain n=1 Tax=Brevinema andersonii TaxID=34097 RepID=A0A1I1D2P1_BREAD|nr:M23 family metallopeptidase [Brevinema andersonii]SFB68642.1 Murein DD-endopeptidase MepM and murein hydrolase activator NlpD, contain LysM domain [Brevinema andersonii]
MIFKKKESSNYILSQDLRFFDEQQVRKNLWLRIKRFFISIKKQIHDMGIRRLSIIVVPHTGKSTWNLQISNYIMFFLGIVFTVVMLSTMYVIANHQQSARNQVRLVVENSALEKKIGNVSQTVDSLSEYFSQFRLEVNSIINSSKDNIDSISLNDPELSVQNTSDTPREIVQLQRLQKELDVTKEKIFRVGNFMQEYERLLREIPSKYPVATRARITSRFGVRRNPFDGRGFEGHEGMDFATLPGTPIYAAADGVVTKRGVFGGYGNLLEIEHRYGFKTRYGHMQGFAAQVYQGVRVKQGQVIGYVGATGRVTGYHLHYEVWIGNNRTDPEPYAMMLR